jgi:2-dehydro-3-deoxyglucarate aldolase
MMNRLEKIQYIRQRLRDNKASVGSWIQIPHASVAEIMGQAGYDWVAVDLEHGAISVHQLPDMFRALELGNTLPLARLSHGDPKECKQVLDAGAGGVVIPMIESAKQLQVLKDACCWPPVGTRGVGFSRANLFGKNFGAYREETQEPLLIAMIEHVRALDNLEDILQVDGLDAVFLGPYDLSASIGLTGQFEEKEFKCLIQQVLELAKKHGIPCGMHVVQPDRSMLEQCVAEGHQFIAYSIDAVFLNHAADYAKYKL